MLVIIFSRLRYKYANFYNIFIIIQIYINIRDPLIRNIKLPNSWVENHIFNVKISTTFDSAWSTSRIDPIYIHKSSGFVVLALTAATFCKAVNGNEIAGRFPSATNVESRSLEPSWLVSRCVYSTNTATYSFERSLSTRYHDGFARCVRISDRVTGDSRVNEKDREPRDRSEREGEENRRGTEEKGAVSRVPRDPAARESQRARSGGGLESRARR